MFSLYSCNTQRSIRLCLLTILSSFCGVGLAQDANEWVDRMISAHGGEAAVSALSAVSISGQIQVFGGFPGTFKIIARTPGQYRMDWDIGYASDVLSVDGDAAWQRGASARELGGDERSRLSRIPIVLRLGQLRAPGAKVSVDTSTAHDNGTVLIRFRDTSGRETTLHVDSESHLLVRETRQEPYEEGPTIVSISYDDYREEGGSMVPFLWRWSRPDMKMRIMVEAYQFGAAFAPDDFAYPHAAAMAHTPYQLALSTLPLSIYKEDDGQISIGEWYRGWGTPYAPSESWSFHAVVNEKYGRYVEPERAVIALYSGDELLRTVELGASVLNGTRSYPAARFNSIPEIYNFRHAMHEVKSAGADRINYVFHGRTPQGHPVSVEADFPLGRYQPKNSYIFPLKGKFLIPVAHDYDMLSHSYERSQHFSYDILALGPDFELAKNGGAKSADFFSFRNTEIIAPAAGTIVYARNDVPDIAASEEYLRTVPDSKKAIGGNLMIIDHGHGEFSLLAHMAQGTVRVKTGDHVEQGQVLGLLGSAGSGEGFPHLHYQLQAGPGTFENDPLPVVFEKVSYTGFFKMDGATVLSPGLPYEAK